MHEQKGALRGSAGTGPGIFLGTRDAVGLYKGLVFMELACEWE